MDQEHEQKLDRSNVFDHIPKIAAKVLYINKKPKLNQTKTVPQQSDADENTDAMADLENGGEATENEDDESSVPSPRYETV